MKTTKFFLLAILITCFACNRNNDDLDDNPDDVELIQMNQFDSDFTQNYGASIEKDIMAVVVDVNRNPLQGVTIEVDGDTQTTDTHGIAILRDASVFENFGYIKATKPGFIHASRSFVPTPSMDQVYIIMLPETVTGTTASGSSTTISNGAGASVELNGNYIKPDGTEYSGSVDVILHHLDPTDSDMPFQMPGMLYAQDQDGEEQGLITLGMLAVELRGDNGEDLNLMAGSKATITVPVDSSLIANAPATIPLWYFDEDNGVWIEEGEANLVGNAYIGEVSHFSFWNCDIPTDVNNICFVLTDSNSIPLSNLEIAVISTNYGYRKGFTNVNGEICGFVPTNEVLEIIIYKGCTSAVLQTINVGPFNTNQTITIPVASSSGVIVPEQVIGSLIDCTASPITNGYLIVEYSGGGARVPVNANGTFNFNVLRCGTNTDININGVNIDTLEETTEQTFSFTTPFTDVGNLIACTTVAEYIEYNIDNGATTFFTAGDIDADLSPPNSSTPHPTLSIFTYDQTNQQGINLIGRLLPNPYIGLYDPLDIQDPNDQGFAHPEGLFGPMLNNTMEYNLTALGPVGDYIDLTFNGTYEDTDGTVHTLTGTVHAIRDN